MKIFDFNDIRDYNGTATRNHYTRVVVPRHLVGVVIGVYDWLDNFGVSLPRQDLSYVQARGAVHIVFNNHVRETQGERLLKLWQALSVLNVPIFWKPDRGDWREVHQIDDKKFYLTTVENMV